MYAIEELVVTFKEDAKRVKRENEEFLRKFKENFPDDPVPDHMTHEFSVCEALASICSEILEIKKRIEK